MTDAFTPRMPRRPFVWPDVVLDLQDEAHATETPAYIVGGAVRDAYLGRALHDIDLATPADPVRFARHIADAFNGDVYVMDAERGVARVMIDRPDGHYVVDVAAFRGDGLLLDLQDRDFTFNAIAVDLLGDLTRVIDPLDGETDLFDKVLRRCSPTSLSDDPIRALRAVRQSAQFNIRIEPQTLADIHAVAPQIATVSAERLRDEFFKVLRLTKVSGALRIAERLGLLKPIFPALIPLQDVQMGDFSAWDSSLYAVDKMQRILTTISPRRTDADTSTFDLGMIAIALGRFRPQMQAHISAMWPDDRNHEALLILAALAHAIASPHPELDIRVMIEEAARDMRLSVDEIRRLKTAVSAYREALNTAVDDLSVHRFWHRYGVAGIDLCLVGMAVYLSEQGRDLHQDHWIALLERIRILLSAYFERHEAVVAPPPLIDGDDLMQALGLTPGKHIGDLLTAIREAQVTGDVTTRDDALALARAKIR